jgi:signal transduction histidine kinase
VTAASLSLPPKQSLAPPTTEDAWAHLHAVLEQAPLPIAVYEGSEHRVSVFNAHARELLRDRRPPVVGERLIDALPELRGSPTLAILDDVFKTGVGRTVREEPLELMRGDGTLEKRWLNLSFHPIRNGLGEVSSVITSAHEVTEEVERRQAAQAANRAKDEFLAMLGHELRNPLTPIVSALDLMKTRPRHGRRREDEVRAREVIERQVRHLVGLVDDLLDVARITRGKIRLDKRPLELSTVVAAAVEVSSPLFESRNHRLTIEVPSQGLRLFGDAERLTQVISNLLTNAAKYTDSGGQVTLKAALEGRRLHLSVKDNGVGLAPGAAPSIFEPFVQEGQRLDRRQGGLGLGLALVKKLVTMHRGTVSAHSEGKGKGSEFVVTLPALSARPSRKTRVVPPRGRTTAHPARRRRVLLVDDNADITDTLATLLRKQRYDVATAYAGPEALQLATVFKPDVAVVDIGLPDMDGYHLARLLRRQPGGKRLRLVALTGYGLKTDRTRSARAGFDVHLTKPVDLAALGAALSA